MNGMKIDLVFFFPLFTSLSISLRSLNSELRALTFWLNRTSVYERACLRAAQLQIILRSSSTSNSLFSLDHVVPVIIILYINKSNISKSVS